MIRALILALLLAVGAPAAAQTFPPLTGRVVDQADLLSPQQEAELTGRLEALEQASSRQLVVATIADLEGYPIEDYGYRLGRHWRIGQREANNGIILIVAPSEKRVRIEVGYGLEPIVTDALASVIIQNDILPRFRAGDFPAGIFAGTDALIQQLQAPPEAAEQRVLEANRLQGESRSDGGESSPFPLVFWLVILFFIIVPLLRAGFRGRKYRGKRRGLGGPIVIWGPGWGGSSGSSSGSSWGGFGGGGFGGGGGFSGGGSAFSSPRRSPPIVFTASSTPPSKSPSRNFGRMTSSRTRRDLASVRTGSRP